MTVSKKQVFSGFFWRFSERIAAQLVTFIVSIVLARLLSPADYGAIALITVFISIANVFVNDSFSSALIQGADIRSIDFSTVFYFNIVFSLVVYLIIAICAPLVSTFYQIPVLCPALRVLALQIPISAVKSVQQAYVSRNMMFKRFFFSTIGGTLVSAILGIVLAYRGYGIWALVIQYLSNSFIDTLVLWVTVKWRPVREFSLFHLKRLFGYGSKILGANLIYTLYTQLRSVLIGKVYSTKDLAYYTKGRSFPDLLITNLVVTISSVLFPTISSAQGDWKQVKNITRKSIKCCSFMLSPLLLGLLAIAKPVIVVLLKEKWLPCVPYLRIACIGLLLQPLQTANQEAIKAIGRSDIYFKLELIKRPFGIFMILFSIRYGVLMVAITDVFMAIISYVINAFPSNGHLRYSYKEQIKDVLPNFIRAGLMAAGVWGITLLHIAPLLQIILAVFAGAGIYIGLSYITKAEDLFYMIQTIKGLRYKKG